MLRAAKGPVGQSRQTLQFTVSCTLLRTCQYTQFYELTYDLAENGGCGDNQYNMYTYADQDQAEQGAKQGLNAETIKQNFQNCRDNYAVIGVDIDNLDIDGK